MSSGDAKNKGNERFGGVSGAEEYVNPTAPGQLKDMSGEMAKSYMAEPVEAAWDSYWTEQGYFKADNTDTKKEKYVMVLPPPNVTGNLHVGHALMLSIQDCLMRWHRMCGKNVLWLPGTDHAGIATQVVVEKKLAMKGLTRHDLGREAFVEEVWKWKNAREGNILSQIKRMGCSLDWSRYCFTLDPMACKSVTEAFVRLFEKGKIYRANRLVDWSCSLQTAISRIEVDTVDIPGPTMIRVPGYEEKVEVGVMHKFAYKLKGGENGEELVIATTRIETMLGDVAVAVHPSDDRYKAFVGKELVHPFLPDRKIVVVEDDILVDMKLGTACVKITPGHDENDFNCGQRHKLPQINILTDAGAINEHGGPLFEGLPRYTARTKVIEELEKLGLYRGKDPNPMALKICSRSKDLVEPVLRPQWWVDCQEMGAKGMQSVKDGRFKIIPESKIKTWDHFLGDIQDWCISRQLWWGHRIPAWQIHIQGQEDSLGVDINDWVVARTEEEAFQAALARHPDQTAETIRLEQDPDVLDTWFSSGLWPFSTLGWPDDTPDLKAFYPGHLLETGHDIIFFWVARMVMMGEELMGEVPFHTTFLHSLVRDKKGDKMSKSKGNVVDPLCVIRGITLEKLHESVDNGLLSAKELKSAHEGQKESFPDGIPPCGADALRFGLLWYTSAGKDINMDINVVVKQREFCNKLWNAVRFTLGCYPDDFVPPTGLEAVRESVRVAGDSFADLWILHRLATTVKKVNECFESYDMHTLCITLRQFWLTDFCADYLEMSKAVLYSEDAPAAKTSVQNTMFLCLRFGLVMLHPVMPFVTEELFHRLPGYSEAMGSIVVADFPRYADFEGFVDTELDTRATLLRDVYGEVRKIRARLALTKTRVNTYLVCSDAASQASAEAIQSYLATQSKAKTFTVLTPDSKQPDQVLSTYINEQTTLLMDVAGLKELGMEVLRREKQVSLLESRIESVLVQQSNPSYAEKTAADVQEKNTAKLTQLRSEIKEHQEMITELLSVMDDSQKKLFYEAAIEEAKRVAAKATKQLVKINKSLAKKPDHKKSLAQKAESDKIVADSEAQIEALTGKIAALAL